MRSENGARVAQALRWCRDLTRRRARNFYYGLKLAPEPQRSALYTIYAWMRRADDLVDDGSALPEERLAALEAFAAQTDAIVRGNEAAMEPLWIALAHVVDRFPIRVEHLHDMLAGQRDDIRGETYETFADLERYCRRVASSVGLVCIEIWGYDDPQAPTLAAERGIAFQLTNILRDFRQDLDTGRVYLPADELARAGLSAHTLAEWTPAETCESFIANQVERAQSYYASSAPLDAMITSSCRPTLWAMTTIYHGLLERIRETPQRIVGPRRISLSTWQKATIALHARRQQSLAAAPS